MNVRKIAAFSLLTTLSLSSVSSAFAQESKSEDGYLEAEIVHIKVETESMDGSVSPYGLLPATEKEMEASAARKRKSFVPDGVINTNRVEIIDTEPEVLMAYDTQILASLTEGTTVEGEAPEVIMAYLPQESMPYNGSPEIPCGLLPATEEEMEKSKKSTKKQIVEDEMTTLATST